MLRILRNMTVLDYALIREGLERIRASLPETWKLTETIPEPCLSGIQPDGLINLQAPDGTSAEVLIEAKQRLSAQVAADLGPRLADAMARTKAAGAVVIAPFLSRMSRERLAQAGVSYLDLSGNARIVLNRPAVLIESQGAEKDPNPPERSIRSLKGGKAARIVRALCDWFPPVGVRELAGRAGADPGYTSRVLSLLEKEDVIGRQPRGDVTQVKWQDLLRRWTQDYQVTKTNRAVPFLAPRGVDSLISRLQSAKSRYAVTGSFAVPVQAAVAPSRLLSCYVDDPERAAVEFDLRPTERGANVLLLEPFDSVVWERKRSENGRTAVALSQCVADLLAGTGREPVEAEALTSWMERNQDAWRARS
jgi:hypothetical protein